jgi:hypothetical protein
MIFKNISPKNINLDFKKCSEENLTALVFKKIGPNH